MALWGARVSVDEGYFNQGFAIESCKSASVLCEVKHKSSLLCSQDMVSRKCVKEYKCTTNMGTLDADVFSQLYAMRSVQSLTIRLTSKAVLHLLLSNCHEKSDNLSWSSVIRPWRLPTICERIMLNRHACSFVLSLGSWRSDRTMLLLLLLLIW